MEGHPALKKLNVGQLHVLQRNHIVQTNPITDLERAGNRKSVSLPFLSLDIEFRSIERNPDHVIFAGRERAIGGGSKTSKHRASQPTPLPNLSSSTQPPLL